MADWKDREEILPALLDRLTDDEPANRSEARPPRAQVLRAIKASLRRDLEWLLNTRRSIQEPQEWMKEVQYSLYMYGLPDLTSYSLGTSKDQGLLANLLEEAVAKFEPRLSNVIVNMIPLAGTNRILKFQIEGVLLIDTGPERIQFDTTLELASGSYTVEGGAGA
ncbi:MAG: type VI secretion system baseplate subunit TssE [Bryobacteraceae bacterium]|jgi:type VI secretion system protein ImpF|nr:type VI secretion system baseplate subunit TssE [Bryobacteraceae bacterium]